MRNVDPATGLGTGFTFDEYSSRRCLAALRGALEDLTLDRRHGGLQVAGMQENFSWTRRRGVLQGVRARGEPFEGAGL